MGLQDIDIKREYRSPQDNIPRDFYFPLLEQAVLYDRAVGFFSSTILARISAGISALRNNGGKIRIVASPHLTEDDVAAIRRGYEKRDEIIKSVLLRDLQDPKNEFEKKHLNILANLIADGVLDIKIAFTDKKGSMGMYHEKLGLISDSDGSVVAFSGSMNESNNAATRNYETIDVFCSWKSEEQAERVNDKKKAFEAIWNNADPELKIIEFPDLSDTMIKKYKRTPPDYDEPAEEPPMDDPEPVPPVVDIPAAATHYPAIPTWCDLRPYQLEAIGNWKAAGYRGIFDMATGTGKTLTGLGALVELAKNVNNKLAVIVVAPYQHLVEQWVEDIEAFNIKPIVGHSESKQRNWERRLDDAILDQKLGATGKEFFLFICTNATFATPKVQDRIKKIQSEVLLIVDEAHNIGAASSSKLLTDKYDYRLALSATIDRHNDEEGTQKLFKYFGGKCIEYTLEDAIEKGNLTRYFYYPIITTLDEEELDKYAHLSFEIAKEWRFGDDGKRTLSEKGKRLAMQRSRLVAGARDKLPKLEAAIAPFKNESYLLVYCGATNVLSNDYSDDERQIELVSKRLYENLGMKTSRFTSAEDMPTRKRLKDMFGAGDLQALVAIRCLDEGVNIPAIRRAFILASTTNPKEYVQRRGRVLRLYKGKEFAYIYDFITLPRPLANVHYLTEGQREMELSLVKNELKRATEFARLANNMPIAQKVIDEIKQAYSINEHLLTDEQEYV